MADGSDLLTSNVKRIAGCVAIIAIAISLGFGSTKTIAITGDAPPPIPPTIQKLIQCESQGQNIARPDSNGKMSYGILQYQMTTWLDFEQLSGIHGSPMDEQTAIDMAEWAVAHAYLRRWTCAHILGMVK